MGQTSSLGRLLLLRARAGRVPLSVTDRTALSLPRLRRDAEDGRKLGVDLLSFGDEVFDSCDVGVDIHCDHLLSSNVRMSNVPPSRCHGSCRSCSSDAAFKRGSTGGIVLKRNCSGQLAWASTTRMT